MTNNVGSLNLKITMDESIYLSYEGHMMLWETSTPAADNKLNRVTIECSMCGKEQSMCGEIPDQYMWLIVLYLVGKIDESCSKEIGDVVDNVKQRVKRHVGKSMTRDTLSQIEYDARSELGPGVSVEIADRKT